MGRSLGVSDSAADIDSGKVLGLSSLSTATGSTVGFYGTTPIAQRSGGAQAAVTTTAATSTTPYGFSTVTQANAVITLINELRASLVAYGVIAGA